MAQLSDDCFAFGGPLLGVDAAVALLGERIAPVAGIENVALAEAEGRALAADVTSPAALPPFDNSAVDGYAVAAADLAASGDTRLPVAGRIAAGAAACALARGAALRIFTGAPMPDGADTVFMQEDARLEGGAVVLPAGLKRGANRRRAGEDISAGARLLPAGRIIRPQDIALAAAVGLERLPVRRRLSVALFSTGDELAEPGAPLASAAIYDSNRHLLASLLRRQGAIVSDLGILRDDRTTLADALAAAGRDHDLVLTSGGVSTGEEDHVKAAVERVGSLVFWRIGIKPGRPVALGLLPSATAGERNVFVGLPGNPVAAYVTFAFVVRPLLARLAGGDFSPPRAMAVRSGFAYRKKAGRREYVRVSLVAAGDGEWIARKHPREGAGVITSLTETDGLLELEDDRIAVAEGETVRFYPYAALA